MSKVYYTESYKLLYDIFNKYVSNPLFPLTHIKESNFLTETNRFTVNRILPIFSKMNAKLRYISSGSTGHFFKGVIIKDENKPICDSNIITKLLKYVNIKTKEKIIAQRVVDRYRKKDD